MWIGGIKSDVVVSNRIVGLSLIANEKNLKNNGNLGVMVVNEIALRFQIIFSFSTSIWLLEVAESEFVRDGNN
jgi:hypothetical protein